MNPDGIRNQIEGGIVQSIELDAARGGELRPHADHEPRLERAIRSCASPDVPDSVDVHVIDRPGEPFLGTGEAAQGPTAAALANAIADATGVRIRELPLTPGRVKQALGV